MGAWGVEELSLRSKIKNKKKTRLFRHNRRPPNEQVTNNNTPPPTPGISSMIMVGVTIMVDDHKSDVHHQYKLYFYFSFFLFTNGFYLFIY